MSDPLVKQKNRDSQTKRINKRTAMELFCVVLVLAKGYKVEFRKPRYSTKTKPFILIERIFNENGTIFYINNHDIQELVDQSHQRQKEKSSGKEKNENTENSEQRLEIKEIRTSIVMNKLIEIIRDKTIKPFLKRKYVEQIIPQFPWLSSIQIDNRKYTQKEIVEIGELMFDVVDYAMATYRFNLVFDYEKIVDIIKPEKDKRLVEFFNLIEHRRRWVYELVNEEKEFQLNEEMKK